jgi:putative transposase
MRPRRETTRRSDGCPYFVSTQTAGRKPFFRHERWARLLVSTLEHYSKERFTLHAYVVMPDHLHLLIPPMESLEKAVQLIKGGFSFRAKRELEWKFDIWQPGFSDHRVRDEEDWLRHLDYIRQNPLDAKLVEDSALYEFMGFPEIAFPQGLKPRNEDVENVRAEARTLHESHDENITAVNVKERVLGSCDRDLMNHGVLAPAGTSQIPFPNTNGTGHHATQK